MEVGIACAEVGVLCGGEHSICRACRGGCAVWR